MTTIVKKPLQKQEISAILEPIAREAYEEYAHIYGTSQSFDRIHQRGGFGTIEIIQLLYKRCCRLQGKEAEVTWNDWNK